MDLMNATDEHAPRLTRRRCLGVLSAATVGLTAGCHSFDFFGDRTEKKDNTPTPPPGAPWKYTFRLPPYLFFSDFELDQKHAVFRELTGLRDQVYKELQLPPGTAVVQVYLFEDRDHYQAFMDARHPGLPKRRAFFIGMQRLGGADDLLVYTFWGERIQQDLRHELTHALLHSVLKEVPLWLDEGLAEYFELPPEHQGINGDYVRKLRSQRLPFKPDLTRLEALKDVGQMNPAEYHEAWAWTHLMLRGRPESKKVLLDYLHQLRTTPNAPPLGPILAKVLPAPEDELLRHLDRIDLTRVATATP
jgi:hypothetical protein